MRQQFRQWLLANRSITYLLAAVTSLVLGALASELYGFTVENDYRENLAIRAQREARGLELETVRGQAMGIAALLGLNEPFLKQLVEGKRPPDDSETLARLKNARTLLRADGIYAIDRKGIIVAHETDHEHTTGKNVSFRPYWQEAIVGNENVYAAVGSKSGERGLYIATAIRAGSTSQSPIIGVVVIKILAGYLDYKLLGTGIKAALLSPQGVMFAASEKEWLFALSGTATATRVEEIGNLKQFGKSFESGTIPILLPFDPAEDTVTIGEQRHAVARGELNWNDPSGNWTVLLLGDLSTATPLPQRVATATVTGLMLFMLAVIGLRGLRASNAHRLAVAEAQRAAEQLAADARIKRQQAELVSLLPGTRDAHDLAQTFITKLSALVPLHQGCLYGAYGTTDEAADRLVLKLLGTYGTVNAPVEISPGEGLIGQCALERQTLCFNLLQESTWPTIISGLGHTQPRNLLILPIMNKSYLVGVLELASLDENFISTHRITVEELLPFLSVRLEVALAAQGTITLFV